MKIDIILFLNLFLLLNSLDANSSYSYENAQKCLTVEANEKSDCHAIPNDYTNDEKKQIIACCYVTYNSDAEGKVEKCVPIFKTTNGLYMYEEQLKNIGGTKISMDCSSKRIIISFLMISIIFFLL